MSEIILKSVEFVEERDPTTYVTAIVVDCAYGYEGVKLIYTQKELERYYYGLSSRTGLNEIIKAGSSLLIKRLNRAGTSNSSLRILQGSPLRYTHPPEFDIIDDPNPWDEVVDLDAYNTALQKQGLAESVQFHRSHTYNYVIDFGDSDMLEGDFIAIPKFTDSNLDNSVLFYFTDFEPDDSSSVSLPDDFDPPVLLDSIGTDLIAINSQRNELKANRAKIIYDWYVNNLVSDSRYFMISGGRDYNVIKSLCELDEENNKVTLVFKKPVSLIHYNKSIGEEEFSVYSDEYLDYKLLTDASLENAVVSFESNLVGSSEFKLTLDYVQDYEFNLRIQYRDEIVELNVSLDRSAIDFTGSSLYIEDVIDRHYDLLKCHVNLGTRIESTDPIDHFSESDAKEIEGIYYVSTGRIGDAEPVYDGELGYNRYPFYDSVDDIVDSDVPINIFLFDDFFEKRYQLYAETRLITPNSIIGITSIPDEYLDAEDKELYLDNLVLDRSRRSNILYVLGASFINVEFVRNAFYYALVGVRNKYTTFVKDNKFISQIKESDKPLLDKYKINYLEDNIDDYYINFIQNFPEYLEPSYLYVANYVHRSIERFLKANISRYPEKLNGALRTKLSVVGKYSTLIEGLTLEEFVVNDNEVHCVLELSLAGLASRVVHMNIKINK